MKECTECKKLVSYNNFYPGNKRCKICCKNTADAYGKTLLGFISSIYNNQKKTSRKRGHAEPSYSRDQLFLFCKESKKFMGLFERWREKGYNRIDRPTIDRIDDRKGYSKDNIQILSCIDNCSKAGEYGKKFGVRVNKILGGKIIDVYDSISEAARQNNCKTSGIHRVLRGERISHAGFKWEKYEKELV